MKPPDGLVRPSGPESAAFDDPISLLVHEGEWNGEYNDYRPSWTYYRCGLHPGLGAAIRVDGQVTCLWCIARLPRVDWMTQT